MERETNLNKGETMTTTQSIKNYIRAYRVFSAEFKKYSVDVDYPQTDFKPFRKKYSKTRINLIGSIGYYMTKKLSDKLSKKILTTAL